MNSGTVEPSSPSSRPRMWGVVLLVGLSFAIFATIRAPIPGVNEPHYLCKARNFWDPTFCPGDPFLESTNAHYVFYATIGWFTSWLSLPAAAWVGRLLGWFFLATGWTLLIRQMLPQRFAPLWAAWILLGLAAVGNFSGEWIIGGVEAKVFGYAFAFASLGLWQQGKWELAALLHGLSISFHPVIGVWSLLAALFAILVGSDLLRGKSESTHGTCGTSLKRGVVSCVCLIVGAMPGLIPALQMLGGDRALSQTADFIQVFHRLKHHLDPSQFPLRAYVGYAVLILNWIVFWRLARLAPTAKLFRNYVWGSLILAAVGLGIGLGPRWAGLMKFYPFRLADACVPVGVAIAVVGCGERWLNSARWNRFRPWGERSFGLLCGMIFVAALVSPAVDRNPSRLSPSKQNDWLATCRWIKQHTQQGALCLAPQEGWGFKWYAQRPEYVSFKDCPQDAAGIVDWNNRLRKLHRWGKAHKTSGYTEDALQELHSETGIDYLIASRMRPFFIKPIYQNKTFRVYKISE